MKESSPVHRFARMVLVSAVLLVLAACSNGALQDMNEAPTLAPQASGSFSSGSLLRGSVIAQDLAGVGVGGSTTYYKIKLSTEGTLWYECLNNGGNSAPGQYDFVKPAPDFDLSDYIDDRGRFEGVSVMVEDPPLSDEDDCKNNWFVKMDTSQNPPVPLTFTTVSWVRAELYEVPTPDSAAEDGTLTDTIYWQCDDPAPSYPLSADWVQEPLAEKCELDPSEGGKGRKIR